MRQLPILLALTLLFAGCSTQPGRQVADSVTAMGGAQATGAGGASMVAPPAAAEPSEQHSEEVVVYESSVAPAEHQAPAIDSVPPMVEFHLPVNSPLAVAVASDPSPAVSNPSSVPQAPRPIYRRTETYTKLGAQQEVTPMLKQAGEFFGRLNKAHWLGILAVLVGFGGVLHSAGNKDSGYPLCWLKVMGGGVLTITMGDALWFWVLCGLAALLYAGQKLGIIRIPGVPAP